MTYEYKLDNFLSLPTNNDKRLIIKNKNYNVVDSITNDVSHYFVKNNCLIIKITNKNDLILSFENKNIAQLALDKFYNYKKILNDIISYYVDVLVQEIEIIGDNEVGIGSTSQMSVNVLPGNATNKTVTWSISGTSFATINSDTGIITGVSTGTTTIVATATDGSGVYGTKQIDVFEEVLVEEIIISGDEVDVGSTLQMTVEVLPEDATNKTVVWSVSGSTDLVTIDSITGIITGVTSGTTTIVATATDGSGVYGTKEVVVSEPEVLIESIQLTSIDEVEIGYTIQIYANILPENATNKTVVWSVSGSTDLVTIDSITGIITGVTSGTTNIVATATDGSGVYGTKQISVTDEIVFIPSNLQVGDYYGGGMIIYIAQVGDPMYESGKIKGVVVALENVLEEGYSKVVQWGSMDTFVNFTSNFVGQGKYNSDRIVNAHNALDPDYYTNPLEHHEYADGTLAAKEAIEYTGYSYNNWGLPTTGDWSYIKAIQNSIPNLDAGSYWLSDESAAHAAFWGSTVSGTVFASNKNAERFVRPVRNFEITDV